MHDGVSDVRIFLDNQVNNLATHTYVAYVPV